MGNNPGLTVKQSMGWGWTSAVPPEDLQLCLDRWAHACATGEPYEIECRLKRQDDGVYRWFLGSALSFRDDFGAIIKWFGTATDIDDHVCAK